MTDIRQKYEIFRRVFSSTNFILATLTHLERHSTLVHFLRARNSGQLNLSFKLDQSKTRLHGDPIIFTVHRGRDTDKLWIDIIREGIDLASSVYGIDISWVTDQNGNMPSIEFSDPEHLYEMLGTPKTVGKKLKDLTELPTSVAAYYLYALSGKVLETNITWAMIERMTPTEIHEEFDKLVSTDSPKVEKLLTEFLLPWFRHTVLEEIEFVLSPNRKKGFSKLLETNRNLCVDLIMHSVETSFPRTIIENLEHKELLELGVYIDHEDIDHVIHKYVVDFVQDEEDDTDAVEEVELNTSYTELEQKADELRELKRRRIELMHKWDIPVQTLAYMSDDECESMWLDLENGVIITKH